MTPTEINAAIVEIVGTDQLWMIQKRGDEPMTLVKAPVPNYYGDLNAIHKAVMSLPDRMKSEYIIQLAKACPPVKPFTFSERFVYVEATAPQRCEAFLRAHGKWRSA